MTCVQIVEFECESDVKPNYSYIETFLSVFTPELLRITLLSQADLFILLSCTFFFFTNDAPGWKTCLFIGLPRMFWKIRRRGRPSSIYSIGNIIFFNSLLQRRCRCTKKKHRLRSSIPSGGLANLVVAHWTASNGCQALRKYWLKKLSWLVIIFTMTNNYEIPVGDFILFLLFLLFFFFFFFFRSEQIFQLHISWITWHIQYKWQ